MDADDLLENASVNVELQNQANVPIQSQGQIPTEKASEMGYVPFNKPESATQRVTQERSMAIKEALQSGQPYMDSDQVRPTNVKHDLIIDFYSILFKSLFLTGICYGKC